MLNFTPALQSYDAMKALQTRMDRFNNETDAKELLVSKFEKYIEVSPSDHYAGFAYEQFQKGLTMTEIENAINTVLGKRGVL